MKFKPLLSIRDHIRNFFDNREKKKVRRDYEKNGKKIGLFGMPSAGKTVFSKYLRTGEYTKASDPKNNTTTYSKPILFEEILLNKESKVKIYSLIDLKSHQKGTEYSEENNYLEKSDIILYFFDVNKLYKDKDKGEEQKSYFNDIKNEIELFAKFFREFKEKGKGNSLPKDKVFIPIGTHYDEVENKQELQNYISQKEHEFKKLFGELKCKQPEPLYFNSLIGEEIKKTKELIDEVLL